ncbi:hypothetical protein CNR22_16050 [Sphingobacteriaceae bacterium]|nr:hypothetical protein CNR22_16050 [Sphingobacteriaceae bacterium]
MFLIRLSFLVSLFFLNSFTTRASVWPKDGAKLNATFVYLEEEIQDKAVSYELTVYKGQNGKSLVSTINSALPSGHLSGLDWNTQYVWIVKAFDGNKNLIHTSSEHNFTIEKYLVSFQQAEETNIKIKVNNKEKNAGGFIGIDHIRGFVNREGQPVWQIPNIARFTDDETLFRDIKITEDNTVTFLTPEKGIEISLDGEILWSTPAPFVFKKDTVMYHHEFQKTPRGTYMILANRKVKRPMPGQYKPEQIKYNSEISVVNGVVYKKTQMTVLLEFDKTGKLIWFWDADTYIVQADLMTKKYPNGMPVFSTHSNAFCESKDEKFIYVSFRDISRVVKIDKKTKQVMKAYGENFTSAKGMVATNDFRRQHDGTLTDRGTLLIFDNSEQLNETDSPVSSFIEMKENPGPKDSAVIWRFPMNFDKDMTFPFSSGGGNMVELPNSNFLLCAGVLNRVVEISRDKEIVWDAIPLMKLKNQTQQGWKPFPQYRCSWAPAFKDYHFFVSLKDSVQKDMLYISISNSGSADDSYKVELIAGEKVLSALTSVTVLSQANVLQALQIKPAQAGLKNLSVRITSSHDKRIMQVVKIKE